LVVVRGHDLPVFVLAGRSTPQAHRRRAIVALPGQWVNCQCHAAIYGAMKSVDH
jgi:hypothetical protein